MTEQEMAEWLGLTKRRHNTRIERSPQTQVILSVRPAIGPARRFVHVADTISSLQAQIEATKAARKLGLEPQFTIEVVTL